METDELRKLITMNMHRIASGKRFETNNMLPIDKCTKGVRIKDGNKESIVFQE